MRYFSKFPNKEASGQIEKASDEGMYSSSDWRSMMNIAYFLLSRAVFFDILGGVTSKHCSDIFEDFPSAM